MKKILFINGHLNVGGVEKSLIDILKHLNYDKYEVHLMLLEGLGDYADEIPQQVKVHLRPLQGTYGSLFECISTALKKHDWFSLRMRLIFLMMKIMGQKKLKLADKFLLDGEEFDTVVGFRSGICTQIAAYGVKANRRIAWWHHGEINVNCKEYLEVCQNIDLVVSVSSSCKKMLQESMPELQDKLCVIPNMVDATEVEKKSKAFNPYSTIDGLQIVTVGGLFPEKHIENCIYAASILKREKVNFKWHIVGDGPLRSELEKRIIQDDLADVISFEGSQANPYPYIANASMMVHSSYVESQGLVILEALTLGIPCVVTKSKGPLEFIEDGVNGVLTEQGPDQLASEILCVVRKDEYLQQIRNNVVLPRQYSVSSVMEQIDGIV